MEPDKYNSDFRAGCLKPDDYSDIGQAKMLCREYGDELRYSDATDYLRYDGDSWIEKKQLAVGAMEEFLDLQLADAQEHVENAKKVLMAAGVQETVINADGIKALETGQESGTVVVQHILTDGTVDERINSKLEQMASLNGLAIKETSTMSDMPGSPNRNIHKTEDIIVKILDLQREIQKDANELLNLKQEICQCIKQVPDPEGQVILKEMYLRMMKWEQIATILNMSIRKVFQLHDESLKNRDS